MATLLIAALAAALYSAPPHGTDARPQDSSRASGSAAGADFDLDWHSIDGGGGVSAGGDFELAGTIAQHDAGALLSGGAFTLAGGFWAGGDISTPGVLGDLTGDGMVDGADLAILLGAWGACVDCDNCPADLDGNCDVNGADLAILLGAWSS